MLHSFNHIRGHAIHASDGEIGSLHDLYFDDQSTAIRYLVVDTGRGCRADWCCWRRRPSAAWIPRDGGIVRPDPPAGQGQSRRPQRPPVSRREELAIHTYYGWDPYWTVPPVAGMLTPYGARSRSAVPARGSSRRRDRGARAAQSDPHLRSAREVEGYHVRPATARSATSRTSSSTTTWAIDLLGIDTRNWLPGGR